MILYSHVDLDCRYLKGIGLVVLSNIINVVMKYYIDFEASESEKKIISIGCIREDGEEFYSLVFTEDPITKRIEELTGISQEDIDQAPDSCDVFGRFYDWCEKGEDLPEFICYGDGDYEFIDNTLADARSFKESAMLSDIYMNMIDCSKDIMDFFYVNKTISLEKLGKHFVPDMEDQNHNALDDAKLLKVVYEKMQSGSRDINEFKEYMNSNRQPLFARKVLRLNGSEILNEFDSMEEAISWIKTQLSGKDAKYISGAEEKIRKAAKEGSRYFGSNWRIL